MVTSITTNTPNMNPPRVYTLSYLERLFDKKVVREEKINCIKFIRQMTGTSLKEAKDFFEQVVQPTVLNAPHVLRASDDIGSVKINPDPTHKPADLSPPMFLVGQSYHQINGTIVMIIGQSNVNTSYETVYSIDADGNVIHRYNRRDFGRVTGTDFENPDPRNLRKL